MKHGLPPAQNQYLTQDVHNFRILRESKGDTEPASTVVSSMLWLHVKRRSRSVAEKARIKLATSNALCFLARFLAL